MAAGDWITTALTNTAQSYAIEHLAQVHYQEVSRIVTTRVQKVRAAVKERLEKEIRYWDERVHTLKAKELAGKSTGGFTSGHARNFADDLEARLETAQPRTRPRARPLQPSTYGGWGCAHHPTGMLET